MSVNKHLRHVFVLPEDDANRQLATGFHLDVDVARQLQVLTEAGGWTHVRNLFVSDHTDEMRRYAERLMVLLVDFDNDVDRLQKMKAVVPPDLADRVFVLGALDEPEALRRAGLGSYEAIGKAMAADCRSGTRKIWAHELLKHNLDEVGRFSHAGCGFLFKT